MGREGYSSSKMGRGGEMGEILALICNELEKHAHNGGEACCWMGGGEEGGFTREESRGKKMLLESWGCWARGSGRGWAANLRLGGRRIPGVGGRGRAKSQTSNRGRFHSQAGVGVEGGGGYVRREDLTTLSKRRKKSSYSLG